MDNLQGLIRAIVRAKKIPSPTHSKQLQDMTQDLKDHLIRFHAKHLQLQGKYEYNEQATTINKLINKDLINANKNQETISREIAKIAPAQLPFQTSQPTYSTIAKACKAPTQTPKTKVLLIYPKVGNKDQISEKTKLALQNQIQPHRMKLQINRVYKKRPYCARSSGKPCRSNNRILAAYV